MYCSKCGSEISATATFCAACGQAVSGVVPAAPAAMTVSPAYAPPMYAPPVSVAGPAVFYAGFWLRFVAWIVDARVSGVAFVILLVPLAVLSGAGAAIGRIGSGEDIGDDVAGLIASGFILGLFGLVLIVGWLYYALCESSSWQGTVGKKMLGLYVTDLEGRPVSFGRASGRYFARLVTHLIPLAIGYIMAGFTEKKQAIHDMIASCVVLRKG